MPSQKRGDKMRNAAMQEAMRSTMRYRHGAIITKGGKILSQGHNHVRTGFSGPLFAHEAVHLPSNRQMEVNDEDTSDIPVVIRLRDQDPAHSPRHISVCMPRCTP